MKEVICACACVAWCGSSVRRDWVGAIGGGVLKFLKCLMFSNDDVYVGTWQCWVREKKCMMVMEAQ